MTQTKRHKLINIGNLQEGDIVRHIRSGNAYVVIYTDRRTVTAVRALTVTNPGEWEKVVKP